MAEYAFTVPILPGKTQTLRTYITEMTGPRSRELKASRKRLGMKKELVWLQKTPMGDFAVVYWETKDIGRVFEEVMKSQEPFDKWFRDKVLVEVHGMNPNQPPSPLNELIRKPQDL